MNIFKRLKKDNRGVVDNLAPVIISLVGLGMVLVVSFLILGEVADNTTVSGDANASAAVSEVQGAMDSIPGWLPIIVITIIGALLIGLVSMFRR